MGALGLHNTRYYLGKFPECSNAPESLSEIEAFLDIRDNIGMFRHLANDVTEDYEKDMRKRINERA